MNINTKIHKLSHLIKCIIGHFEYFTTKLSLQKNQLYVINYHGTQKKFLPNFRKQIIYFKRFFEIISPAQLNDFYLGKINYFEKPLLLITFDDGFKNNLYAAEILEEYNISAYFFIVPDYINSTLEQQMQLSDKNIYPNINRFIDNEPEDFQHLTWTEIEGLLTKGHVIGSHTQTHRLIAKNSTFENSLKEIETSKKNIAEKLGLNTSSINAFCSTHDTLLSIDVKELRLIKKNYEFHFTTIPGANKEYGSKFFIKRVNIESFWLMGAVKYALGKWDLFRWRAAMEKYSRIMESCTI